MKSLRKMKGDPDGLAEYLLGQRKARQDASWSDFQSHRAGASRDELVNDLTDLQRGLCGYCETAVARVKGARQVEHVVPRSHPDGEARALDVENMIVCCLGGQRSGGLSCGQAKGDRYPANFVDPRELPRPVSVVRVSASGRADADEPACASEGVDPGSIRSTIELLGLNCARLRATRRDVLRSLLRQYARHQRDPVFMREVARKVLLRPKGRALSRFFTTRRSYFRPWGADEILAVAQDQWL